MVVALGAVIDNPSVGVLVMQVLAVLSGWRPTPEASERTNLVTARQTVGSPPCTVDNEEISA
jgi:hypothetical protein